MDLVALGSLLAQAAPAPEPTTNDAWLKPLEVIGGLIISIPTAAVSIYTVRASRKKDPLERRKTELEVIQMEQELGMARQENDVNKAAAISAQPILERRRAEDIVLRFVLLYLVLQVWGLIGNLFDVGVGSIRFIAIVPQVVRALIFVAMGWPLLLDTATFVGLKLPTFVYKAWVSWLLIAIAVLASLSQNLSIFLFI